MTTTFCVYSLFLVRIYFLQLGTYHRFVFTSILMCSFVMPSRMNAQCIDLGFWLNLSACRPAEKRVKVPKSLQVFCVFADDVAMEGESRFDYS